MPFGNLKAMEITRAMKALYTRPRKTLSYLTPKEVFYADVALGM